MARSPDIGDEPDDDGDDYPTLSIRITVWIEKKTKAYHARRTSGKTPAQYKASLQYGAAERLEVVAQRCPYLSDEDQENIVVTCLGKSAAVFHSEMAKYEAVERTKMEGKIQIAEARAEAQAPLLAELKDSREQTQTIMTQMSGFMERMMDKLENMTITFANAAAPQITHQPPTVKEPTDDPGDKKTDDRDEETDDPDKVE